eukprot:SAG22_NODE_16752_length_318_cov_1.187215_1_plen_41_part_01
MDGWLLAGWLAGWLVHRRWSPEDQAVYKQAIASTSILNRLF